MTGLLREDYLQKTLQINYIPTNKKSWITILGKIHYYAV